MGANPSNCMQDPCSICAARKFAEDMERAGVDDLAPATLLSKRLSPSTPAPLSPYVTAKRPPPKAEDVSLRDVLQSESLTQAFIEFTRLEFSEKNLLFELAVIEYRRLVTLGQQDAARQKADAISSQFIDVGSVHEITIQHKDRELVRERLKSPMLSTEAFAPALLVAHRSLVGDQFPRFRTSPQLAKALWREHFATNPAPSA